jgi:hypothetical protein|tara:strand:- start:553 stop:795 length:243 start_codon:yes stop_codon:yes gene_type:complete
MVKGSVTISLDDYHTLIESSIKIKEMEEKFLVASKELQVFLSFLSSRADIEKHVEEFNRQSKTSKITFEGTSAKIELKND